MTTRAARVDGERLSAGGQDLPRPPAWVKSSVPLSEFMYWTLVEHRDGNLWGDMLMELGHAINDEIEGTEGTKKYSFWVGEARELAATEGRGWPVVLRLVGEAIALAAVDPVDGTGQEGPRA